jgi:hypothetical protein
MKNRTAQTVRFFFLKVKNPKLANEKHQRHETWHF